MAQLIQSLGGDRAGWGLAGCGGRRAPLASYRLRALLGASGKARVMVALGVIAMSNMVPGAGGFAHAQGDEAARVNAAAVAGNELPVSRITLYRSGVASMERRGKVTGDATVQLTFSSEQINDILKSMIVLDLGGKDGSGGSVRSVEYASQEGLLRRLASFGIDISDKPTAGQLLDRLRGTKVRIVMVDGALEGTVLNVENKPTVLAGKDGGSVKDLPWINLVTSAGVRSANLTNATGFDILDGELAAELNKALAAIAEMRSEQRKTVNISFEGTGERDVMAAYVQESPVWKTSYRLALGEDDGKPMLQGWAIVENTSEEDWVDVSLSLASGQPSAFRMNLYTPLFTTRPEVSVPVPVMTVARAFEGGVDADGSGRVAVSAAPATAARMSGGRGRNEMKAGAPGSPAPQWSADSAAVVSEGAVGFDPDPFANAMRQQAAASTMQTGDVFFFQIDQPVTVQRKRSAMLPIVSQGVEGKRVSIITSDQYNGFAMRGVRMQNSVGMQLVAGPVAVYDGNVYAGDAQLNDLGQSQHALLGYAADTDVRVVRTDASTIASRSLRVVNGVLEVRMKTRFNTEWAIDNSDAKKGRTMIVEVVKLPGGELVSPKTALETTDSVHRFEVPISKGEVGKASKSSFRVEQERTDFTSYGIVDSDQDMLLSLFGDGKMSGAMQQAFERVRTLQGAVRAAQMREQALVQERSEITTEQERIRQNLGSLDRTSDLAQRLTRKLSDQETRLDAIASEVAKARGEAQRAQAELEQYVSSLNVE